MESRFGTLKSELEMEAYADLRTAYTEIRDDLCYYDTKRRHSSLGYLTRVNSSYVNRKQFQCPQNPLHVTRA
jgi:transposase InsO family protein